MRLTLREPSATVEPLPVMTTDSAAPDSAARSALDIRTLPSTSRLARDYAGAAVLAGYFAVALLGLIALAIGR